MSWIQTAYLIAEVVAIPLTGLLTRVLTLRWLFAVAVSRLHPRFRRLRRQRQSSPSLLVWRVVQGFSGGTLDPRGVLRGLPAVSTARCRPSPPRSPASLAVLAPTIGPIVGGWITQTYSWPWLFLINVIPGIVRRHDARRVLLPGQDHATSAKLAKLDVAARSSLLAAALASA